jgi:hypothetical protein
MMEQELEKLRRTLAEKDAVFSAEKGRMLQESQVRIAVLVALDLYADPVHLQMTVRTLEQRTTQLTDARTMITSLEKKLTTAIEEKDALISDIARFVDFAY